MRTNIASGTGGARHCGAVFIAALISAGCAGVAVAGEADPTKPFEAEAVKPVEATESAQPVKRERTSRISDEAVPRIDLNAVPSRPKPLLELGNPFLGTGNIGEGIELPGGSVWQPSLLVFGTYRTALQTFDGGIGPTTSDWANRLDIFANLQLTGTERFLLGLRPLDERGVFSGYLFRPDGMDDWQDGFNPNITTAFFEGDIGEILADVDPQDKHRLDYGFSIGRQPLLYQEGMLINDSIVDAFGITRNNILPKGGTNLQATFLFAWGNVGRDDNVKDDDVQLIALFLTGDFPRSSINVDFVWSNHRDDDADGLHWGISSVQRIGHFNTTFRVLGSHALGEESAAVSSGYLLFAEVSWTPPWTHDLMYVNAFWGIDEFASAARGEDAGGPLGRVGILFAAVGIGRYGAPLGNRADESVGGAVGYQWFLDDDMRKQIVFELGARQSTDTDGDGAIAAGARYQQAFGQHTTLVVDAFVNHVESAGQGVGGRVEIRFDF